MEKASSDIVELADKLKKGVERKADREEIDDTMSGIRRAVMWYGDVESMIEIRKNNIIFLKEESK